MKRWPWQVAKGYTGPLEDLLDKIVPPGEVLVKLALAGIRSAEHIAQGGSVDPLLMEKVGSSGQNTLSGTHPFAEVAFARFHFH